MSWIETYQNITNLIVCGGVSAILYAYYNISEQYLIPLMSIHFITDLFLTKKTDVMLHNVFGLTIIAYKYIIPMNDSPSTILILYKTEITSLFYVFKILLQKTNNKPIKQFNNLLFFASFFKFRIYDFYYSLTSNELHYVNYAKYNYLYITFVAIHGMFIINLYWFLIICKKALKPFMRQFSQQCSECICHYITSYTMTINLFINIYLYSQEFTLSNSRCLYNICGLTAITIASYNYHMYLYEIVNQYKLICYTSSKTIALFLQDIGAIHFCSFMALLTNYGFTPIVYFSAFLHINFYFANIVHLLTSKNSKTIIYGNNENYNKFISFQYFCIILPNSLDIVLIVVNSVGSGFSMHGTYLSILILLLFIVNPLFDLTHILFHICLILQCICCAKCNMYVLQN